MRRAAESSVPALTDRSLPLPTSAPNATAAPRSDLSDDLQTVRLDRARTELRHGRPLLLPPSDDAAAGLAGRVVAAVETLCPQRLQALLALATRGAPRLLLTAERLQALGWPSASTPRAATLPATVTLDTLHGIAAVAPLRPGTPTTTPTLDAADAQPADAPLLAAIGLTKRARLVPALLVVGVDATGAAALTAAGVTSLEPGDIRAAQARSPGAPQLRRVSDAHVPIAAHEDCTLVLYREIEGDAEHVAILVGPVAALQARGEAVPVRLHSSCLTGDLLGSLRCDCGDQLRRAIDRLAESGGVLLYLSQEGRGTGLANKLRAYRLQDAGLDTLEADRHLGFREDERDFRVAAAMLRSLEIGRIRLLTNNPHKIAALRQAGIDVIDRLPLPAPVNPHNARYLKTKQERAGHLRDDGPGPTTG